MIKSRAKLTLAIGNGIGRGVQIKSARVSARVGARINSVVEEAVGRTGSLIKSFTPSAIG